MLVVPGERHIANLVDRDHGRDCMPLPLIDLGGEAACCAAFWSDGMSTPSRGDVFGFVAHFRRLGRRPSGPNAARKGFPFDKDGFQIRQNEIRQPHSG